MNDYQRLWWDQAKSDHGAFLLFRRHGASQCHSLHYLQMATEKIAKAYLWRSGSPPPKQHAGFVHFLRLLGQIREKGDRQRIATLFTFTRFSDFRNWINRAGLPIAYDIERLSPTYADDGPNPEYPWPHREPRFAPVHHEFEVWSRMQTSHGRNLMRIIRVAIERFPKYADT